MHELNLTLIYFWKVYQIEHFAQAVFFKSTSEFLPEAV